MFLEKDGITYDVEHPSDIARLKGAGYQEVKPAPKAEEPVIEPAPKKPSGKKEPKAEEPVKEVE